MESVEIAAVRPAAAPHTVAASYALCLLDTAIQRGAQRGAMLKAADLDAAQLDGVGSRVPVASLLRLFAVAEQASHDRDIGIHMAENVRPGTFQALGYAAMSCSTLGDAMRMIPRYEALVYDGGRTRVDLDRDNFCVSWQSGLSLSAECRALNEVIVGGWLSFGRWIAGDVGDDRLLVSFRHPAPDDLGECQRFFRCPVQFGALRNSLSGPRSLLDLPLIQRDAELRVLMESQARIQLRRIRTGGGIAAQVVGHIQQILPEHAPSVIDVAARMHMSERTLRRRLQLEGAQFSELVTQVRRELSCHYLGKTSLSMLEIALLLGYSEQSSFTTAFRHWFELSPREYRKQHGQSAQR